MKCFNQNDSTSFVVVATSVFYGNQLINLKNLNLGKTLYISGGGNFVLNLKENSSENIWYNIIRNKILQIRIIFNKGIK